VQQLSLQELATRRSSLNLDAIRFEDHQDFPSRPRKQNLMKQADCAARLTNPTIYYADLLGRNDLAVLRSR
jgi:hypothetical protein